MPVKSRPTFIVLNREIISYREEINPADDGIEEVFLRHGQAVIYKDNELWMTISIGTLKASSIIYGIYTDGTSWYLEVDRGEAFYSEDGTLITSILADIYRDGVSLNESEGYDECFGFAFVSEKLFYFFVRDGANYYHFDGEDYSLDYTHILHHLCCSGGMAEPRAYEDRVIFFADRGDQRYLVFIVDL